MMKQIKSTLFKFMLVGVAACTFTVGAGFANAGYLNINGGTTIVTGSVNASGHNNVLGDGVSMQDNARLRTTEDNVQLDFYYWAAESGYDNTLNWIDSKSHTEDSVDSGTFAGAELVFGGVQAAQGNVAMSFTSSGWWWGGALTPGGGDAYKSIAFAYLDSSGNVTMSTTNTVMFTLDDGGAGPDDNHDDYVGYIRASAVPIPGAAWLFGSSLIAMAGLKRRKQSLKQI